jgi:hypothetical protein
MVNTPFTGNTSAISTSVEGWTTSFDYPVGDFPEHFAVGDVDGDGFKDAVVANLFDDTVSVYYNDGKGKFVNRTDFITGSSGNGPRCVVIADVGEDFWTSDPDIIVANYYGGTIAVLRNDGVGNFSKPINYTCLDDPTWIEVTDLNNDGYIDIISNSFFKNQVGILLNDMTGNFTSGNSYSVGTHPREFTIADIEGDSDMDIITVDTLDDKITVLENIGGGNFKLFDRYKTDGGPRSISAGDINGNGDIDLVIACRHSDTVSVLINRGDGNYSARYDYDTGKTPIKVQVGDVDNDGDNDILCLNLKVNQMRVFNNSGSGNFPNNYNFLLHPGPYHVEIADLDNDADNDLIIVSAYKDVLLTVYHDFPPRIEITEPDGIDDKADLTYTIKWIGTDPDEHNILAVDLFYNMRMTEGEGDIPGRGTRQGETGGETNVVFGIPIVYGTENDGEYEWDCSQVPNGSYQLGASIYDNYGNYYTAFSKYNVTIDHNVPPKLIILNPSDGEVIKAHSSFTIRWADSDPDDNAIINISYDDDNDTENGNLGRLVSDIEENKDGDNDKYKWITSTVDEGEYYIVFEISDGHRESIINYSDGKVRVTHDPIDFEASDITIVEPNGEDDTVDSSFFISWIDEDEDDDAEITLYYDDDNADFNGIEIVGGIMEDDDGKASDGTEINVYHWNTSALDDGEYYVYGKIEDGFHTAYYNYSSGPLTILHNINNQKPTITILEPDGIQDDAKDFYTIKWSDDDPDDNAVIKLYYTPIKEYFTGQFVEGANNIQEDDDKADDFFLWKVSEIEPGDYYIYALITDNRNPIGKAISSGPITVKNVLNGPENIPPFIEITEPNGEKDKANASYIIRWVDYDPDDDALISLYFDTNSSGYNGTLILNLISEDGKNDEFLWHISNLPEGDYYIYAEINDGEVIYESDYSRGPITVDHTTKIDNGPIDQPEAKITSPLTNSDFNIDDEIQFDASGTSGDGLTYLWTSNRDGTLGETYNFRKKLSEGEHQVTLFILDERGQSDSTTIIIRVNSEPEDDVVLVEGLEDWMVYGLIGIIVVLILIIMLAAFVGKGKKKSEKDEGEDEGKDEKKGKIQKGKPPIKPKPGQKPARPPKPKTEAKFKK